jgi:phage shock protein A
MAGRLVDHVNRLIRSGLAHISEDSADVAARSEKSLVVVRHRLGQMIVQRRNLARDLANPPPEAQDLSAKAEMAVRKGREDLARAALAEAEKLTTGRQALVDEIAGLDADIALLESAIAQLTGQQPASPRDSASLQALLTELNRLDTDSGAGKEAQ